MINFKNVTKIYKPNIYALKNVSFNIEAGDFVSIVGRSGTGKTTVIKMIIAEEKPTKGRVVIGDWDITNIKTREVPVLRRQIGVVFQDFKLLPGKTIFENVAFGMEVAGLNYKKIKEIVPQVLKIVGLENKHDRFPKQISGGEQQRAVIARALTRNRARNSLIALTPNMQASNMGCR